MYKLILSLIIFGTLGAEQPDTFSTPSGDNFLAEFMKMMTLLGVIIIGLMFVSYFLKRYMNARLEQMNADSMIKVVERRALTPKTVIYILEVGEKQILMAETPHGVTYLGSNRRSLEIEEGEGRIR